MAVDRRRAAGVEARARVAASPASRAASYAVGASGVLDARRERLAPRSTARLLGLAYRRGAAPLPASTRLAPRRRSSVFRDPSGSRPGLPVPLVDRVTLASTAVRDAGQYEPRRWTVNGVIHELPDGAEVVDKSAGAAARARRDDGPSAASRLRGPPDGAARRARRRGPRRAPPVGRARLKGQRHRRRDTSRLDVPPARAGRARTRSRTPGTVATSRSPPIRRARSRAIGRPRPVPVIRSWSAIR